MNPVFGLSEQGLVPVVANGGGCDAIEEIGEDVSMKDELVFNRKPM